MSSDSVLPRRIIRERGILSSVEDWSADVIRSSVGWTCVRVFLRFRPRRGMIYVVLLDVNDGIVLSGCCIDEALQSIDTVQLISLLQCFLIFDKMVGEGKMASKRNPLSPVSTRTPSD